MSEARRGGARCGARATWVGLAVVWSGAMLLLGAPGEAQAFDYLEHSFFSDRACAEAQTRLAATMASDARQPQHLPARYMALGLLCPDRWERAYCADGYKQLRGHVNPTTGPPDLVHEHAITLGDYAALPDHLSLYGPVRNLPRAADEGLMLRTFAWMAAEPGGAGGVIEDVAEDACETDDKVSWPALEAELTETLARFEARGGAPDLPASALTPLARAPVPRGPSDPAGAYSFDNPHYLDLVLRNHHHFGRESYATWLGFHSTATRVAQRPCRDLMALDADALDDLADGIEGFHDVAWDDLAPHDLRATGCALLAEHVRRRLRAWMVHAPLERLAPVRALLLRMDRPWHRLDPDTRALLDSTVSAVYGLVFEALGVHYLQDNLAGGHIRTLRAARGLAEARYDHDTDGASGLIASFGTRQGSSAFVAFGDSYLIGPPMPGDRPCPEVLHDRLTADPDEVARCLRAHQRAMVLASSAASLLDWAWGGLQYPEILPDAHPGDEAAMRDARATGLGAVVAPRDGLCRHVALSDARFVCRYLPTRSTTTTPPPSPPSPSPTPTSPCPLPPSSTSPCSPAWAWPPTARAPASASAS